MRITNNMISDQVVANLQRSLTSFVNMQVQMSTGRRINKPSDDPIGVQKSLNYRNILTDIAQFKSNIASAGSIMSSYDNILGNMKDLVQSANELAVTLSNDTYDDVAREAAAKEVESLYDQMIELANSTREGRYIFSGQLTRNATLVQSAYGVSYNGDAGISMVEIEEASKIGVNLLGSDIFFKQLATLGEDSNLQVALADTTLLSDLNLGGGLDLTSGATPGQFVITDNNLGTSINIDLSALPVDATLGDAMLEINNQLAAGGFANVTVELAADGNNLQWVATDTGTISGVTSLDNLNGGQGVDLKDGRIRIHTADDSINIEIDLSEAETIDDVINTFNNDPAAVGLGLSIAISADGRGLTITDPLPLEGLIIDDIDDTSKTAANLGLVGAIDAETYQGADLNPISDYTSSEAEPDQTVLSGLGILGSFSNQYVGSDITATLRLTDAVDQLGLGHGLDLGTLRISQGRSFVNLDLGDPAIATVEDILNAINNSGLNILASINEAGTGIQIESTTATETLIIDEIGDGTTAHDLGIYGSPDILGTMTVLIDALRNNDGESAGQLIGNLNEGINHLLNNRSIVGAKVIRLDAADSRLTDLDYNVSELLSEVEDADLTQLVTDLAMKENSYQAALAAAAQIIQPSLLNFLVG